MRKGQRKCTGHQFIEIDSRYWHDDQYNYRTDYYECIICGKEIRNDYLIGVHAQSQKANKALEKAKNKHHE